jgi:hypothetical protein
MIGAFGLTNAKIPGKAILFAQPVQHVLSLLVGHTPEMTLRTGIIPDF